MIRHGDRRIVRGVIAFLEVIVLDLIHRDRVRRHLRLLRSGHHQVLLRLLRWSRRRRLTGAFKRQPVPFRGDDVPLAAVLSDLSATFINRNGVGRNWWLFGLSHAD
jgi:hypothetical protein